MSASRHLRCRKELQNLNDGSGCDYSTNKAGDACRRPKQQCALAHATRILAEMRELSRWAEQARGGGVGQLSIGMIDTAAIHHFGDTLVGFRRNHPTLTVRLLVQPSNALLDQLRAGEVDAIVCVDPDPDDRFVLEPLIGEPLHVYAPPDATTRCAKDVGAVGQFPDGISQSFARGSPITRPGHPVRRCR